jgi:hypothetical protein
VTRAPAALSTAVLLLVLACNGEIRFGTLDSSAPPAKVLLPDRPDASLAIDAAVSADSSIPSRPDTSNWRCSSDVDCKLPSLHCDALSGACVACVVDAQCTVDGARRCDAALHRCVECGVNIDCGDDAQCEPTTRRCVSTCKSLTGCREFAPFCDLLKGVCLRCHADLECVLPGDARTCDPANGKCVQCVSDTECRSPLGRCDRTTGTCAQCLGASDCASPTAPLCDPTTRRCTAG